MEKMNEIDFIFLIIMVVTVVTIIILFSPIIIIYLILEILRYCYLKFSNWYFCPNLNKNIK